MTDSTEKSASIKHELSLEELADAIGLDEWEKEMCGIYDKEILIPMKCIKCGHEANVPDYILGEFIEESHDRNVGIECPKCNGKMIRIR